LQGGGYELPVRPSKETSRVGKNAYCSYLAQHIHAVPAAYLSEGRPRFFIGTKIGDFFSGVYELE